MSRAGRTIRRRGRAAFTLVEVLLVAGLLAVLGAVTAFMVPGLWTEKVEEAAGRIASACERGRAEALRSGVHVRLTLDPDTGEYFLSAESDPAGRPGDFTDLPDGGSRVRTLPEDVSFGELSVGGVRSLGPAGGRKKAAVIEFAPDGTSDAAVIELSSGKGDTVRKRWVLLKPAPIRVSIEDEAPDLPALPSDDLAAGGESNPDALGEDTILNFRNGLGGNNGNTGGTKVGGLVSDEDDTTTKDPVHGVLSTVPGR